MSKQLKKAPIFYSIGEIRFNQTLAVADAIKDIQKNLGAEYPDFSEGVAYQLEMLMASGSPPQTRTVQLPRWNFVNRQGNAGYIIGQNTIVYHTTDYIDSDLFIEALWKGLALIHRFVPLVFVTRVGIRTLDVIPGEDIAMLRQFLTPGALGSLGTLKGNLKQSISQLSLQVGENGTLTSRVAIINGQIGVPQDLAPISLKLKNWVTEINGMHAILDNDSILEERLEIEHTVVEKALRQAKLEATNAFRMSITEHAIAAWS
jgi:uncharacterized protein (TIGR04255 family)